MLPPLPIKVLAKIGKNLESLVTEVLRAIYPKGAKHQDPRRKNMLFDGVQKCHDHQV
jgi:hypothetical protein